MTGLGLVGVKVDKMSGKSHGVKRSSNTVNGYPTKGSEEGIAESMVGCYLLMLTIEG